MQEVMDSTTELVVRSRPNSTTAELVSQARRHPTSPDWQQWAPKIASRYRQEPARLLIEEMNANGLLVTEKMFRDRLRKWGMNDKNRRKVTSKRQRTMGATNNRDKLLTPPYFLHQSTHRGSPQLIMRVNTKIRNVLHTPKETAMLQRAHKGLLDWQQYSEEIQTDRDESSANVRRFGDLLDDINVALDLNRQNALMCGKATRKLHEASTAVRNEFGAIRSPLAVLDRVDLILNLTYSRSANAWYEETLQFLSKTAAETLPRSHPSLLLLRLLFGSHTPEQLAMIYEVGSSIIRWHWGEAKVTRFRLGLLDVVLHYDSIAVFGSYAASLCDAPSNTDNAQHLADLACLNYRLRRYEKSAKAAQTCLALLEERGREYSWSAADALLFLAVSQKMQCNFIGEETFLQKRLTTILVMERSTSKESDLSINVLQAILDLDEFYQFHGQKEQLEDLRLEFPDAFEP